MERRGYLHGEQSSKYSTFMQRVGTSSGSSAFNLKIALDNFQTITKCFYNREMRTTQFINQNKQIHVLALRVCLYYMWPSAAMRWIQIPRHHLIIRLIDVRYRLAFATKTMSQSIYSNKYIIARSQHVVASRRRPTIKHSVIFYSLDSNRFGLRRSSNGNM